MTLKEYWDWLSTDVGCVVCRYLPASIHHCMGGSIADSGIVHGKSQKNNHWLVLPLCHNHHQGKEGLHAIGVRTWERRFGSQRSHVEALATRVSFNLLEHAGLVTV